MTELLTASQMKALEDGAIDSGAVTGAALMEAAGQGVVNEILSLWRAEGQGTAPRAVVLCGPGNNGGDGYVIARLLVAEGWQVALWALAAPDERAPDALAARQAWDRAGGAAAPWAEIAATDAPDVVVDALFGTGLTRPVPAEVAAIFRHVEGHWDANAASRHRPMHRVAVDIPSGLSSDTGRSLMPDPDPRTDSAPDRQQTGWVFAADLTVTFHSPKLGHYLGAGPTSCGRLACVALPGLPICDTSFGMPPSHEGHVRLVAPSVRGAPVDARQYFRDLAKRAGHKFDHGHALVVAGPPGAGGAARLAARAALRIGAGLVTVGCPTRAVSEHAAQLTAIMLKGLDGTAGLAEVLEDRRINALCLGPGLGLGGATGELVKIALAAGRGTVLDADALSRFQRRPESLFEMLHDTCVLTPHGGEFARLFPDIMQKLTEAEAGQGAYSKVDATRDAAARAGCVVLFKGADTVIAEPGGMASVSAAAYGREVPWLATAGAGDVLSGMICGLLARGLAPMQAAELGTWLHVEAARSFGPGLIAEDLPEELPRVFRSLGI